MNQFKTITLKGAKALKTDVIRAMPQSTYIHLATHGFFFQGQLTASPNRFQLIGNSQLPPRSIHNIRNPLVESGLAMAGANVRAPSETATNGLLTAEELVGLDLRQTALVTFSACETGRGRATTGQGVIGLQAVVMAAGARSLLMSLWKVPDAATQKFMTTFYINLWTKKLAPAKALQRAQEAVRQEPKFAHPRHWAAWVLAGEGW